MGDHDARYGASLPYFVEGTSLSDWSVGDLIQKVIAGRLTSKVFSINLPQVSNALRQSPIHDSNKPSRNEHRQYLTIALI
jgi:hypothetical protein